jgi:hypothetical protein
MPDEYGEALAYLRGVRTESNLTPHVFTSKQTIDTSSSHIMSSNIKESAVSLNRLVFQPTVHHKSDEECNDVYQDKDMIVSRSKIEVTGHKLLWRPEWIEQVKREREIQRQRLIEVQKVFRSKNRDAEAYYEKVNTKQLN